MRTSTIANRRIHQRESTRRQLVEAALRVVSAHGFAGATTAAIAKETGKAHGTVFVHFPSREALVSELVAQVGQAMSTRLASLDSIEPTLSDVMHAHLTALADNELLYARLLSEASNLPMAARAQIFALQSGVAWRLREAYQRELANGYVRNIQPITLSNIWISLTNHYLLNRDIFAPGESVIVKCGEDICDQLLGFIAT